MVQMNRDSAPSSNFVEDRIRMLEAMAQEYDQLIPQLHTPSRRRRWQVRADACRFRIEQLRQNVAVSNLGDSNS